MSKRWAIWASVHPCDCGADFDVADGGPTNDFGIDTAINCEQVFNVP